MLEVNMKVTRGICEPMAVYRQRAAKEKMLQEVIAAETLEDLKILIMDWIDDGSIKRRIPPPWEK